MKDFKRTNIEGIDTEDTPFKTEDMFSILHTYKVFREDESGTVEAPDLIRKYRRRVSWDKIPQEVADEMDVFTDNILKELATIEEGLLKEEQGDVEKAFVEVLSGEKKILKDIFYDKQLKDAIGNVALKVYLRDNPQMTEEVAIERVKTNIGSLIEAFESFINFYIIRLGEQCIPRVKNREITLEELRTGMKPKIKGISRKDGFSWKFDDLVLDLTKMNQKKKTNTSDNESMFI